MIFDRRSLLKCSTNYISLTMIFVGLETPALIFAQIILTKYKTNITNDVTHTLIQANIGQWTIYHSFVL